MNLAKSFFFSKFSYSYYKKRKWRTGSLKIEIARYEDYCNIDKHTYLVMNLIFY